MRAFVKTFILFLMPFLVIIPIELKLRDNTFAAKASYLENNKEEIEWLILGSSHNWRAIDPSLFTKNAASLALGGSAIDIDLFLAKHYIDELSQLKRVILEISYHSLEERRGYSWGKNHLLWVHFGLNHYNGPVPWYDYGLISSQPIFYVKKLIADQNKIESGKFNQYGFIDVEPDTSYASITNRFQRLRYDPKKINKTSHNYLDKLHKGTNLSNYEQSTLEIESFIEDCKKRGIEVSIISPPKYKLYNEEMLVEKNQRRIKFLDQLKAYSNVQVLIYDGLNQKHAQWFANENHLNVAGAQAFTSILEKDILNGQNVSYLP